MKQDTLRVAKEGVVMEVNKDYQGLPDRVGDHLVYQFLLNFILPIRNSLHGFDIQTNDVLIDGCLARLAIVDIAISPQAKAEEFRELWNLNPGVPRIGGAIDLLIPPVGNGWDGPMRFARIRIVMLMEHEYLSQFDGFSFSFKSSFESVHSSPVYGCAETPTPISIIEIPGRGRAFNWISPGWSSVLKHEDWYEPRYEWLERQAEINLREYS